MALKITAVTVYALLTVTLALLKGFKVDSRGRGAVKMITAAIFVSAGIYGCVTNGGEYGFVLVIGLAFAFLGDLFLVFMNKRALFISGVISFSCASFTFTVYAVLRFGFQWWALLKTKQNTPYKIPTFLTRQVMCSATQTLFYFLIKTAI